MITLNIYFAGDEKMSKTNLKFNNGTFKILQVSDFQDGPVQKYLTMEYVLKCVEEYKPDIILITGDNKYSTTGTELFKFMGKHFITKTYDSFMLKFEESGIPVAITFGNHDIDGKLSRREQFEIFKKYSVCVSEAGDEKLDGCCNFNLPVMSSDGKKVAFNIWCFDSNDGVLDDKLDWYVRTSDELKNKNGGQPVPSMVFQHHPPLQAIQAVEEAGDNLNGFCHEGVCPDPEDKGKQFDVMLEQGDVVAMFYGHDHINTYCVPYKGIDLACCSTSGFGSYGDFDTRGLRYITVKEDGTYETEMVYYYKKFCNDEKSKARFTMYSNELDMNVRKKAADEYKEFCKKDGTYSKAVDKEIKIALD